MGRNEYSNKMHEQSMQNTWDCPVEGCITCRGRPAGGRKPVKHSSARNMGLDHMDKYHPELDRNSVIIRKWKPEDAHR